MVFSRSCEYGIRAMIYLAGRAHVPHAVPIGTIAEAIASPVAFSSKILQRLAQQGLVRSHRGKSGGFSMDPAKLEIIQLRDIVEAIEGPSFLSQCLLGLKQCSEQNPCPLHFQFKAHRQQFHQLIRQHSLRMLLDSYQNGESWLRIPNPTTSSQ